MRGCTDLLNRTQNRSAIQILGDIDTLKFRSSMTLFSLVSSDNQPFAFALSKYFDNKPDPRTIAQLTIP